MSTDRRGRRKLSNNFSSIALIISLLWTPTAMIGEENARKSNNDELTQRIAACSEAFSQLREAVGDLRWAEVRPETIRQNAAAYQRYDSACQKDVAGLLHDRTRDYLNNRLGALFGASDEAIPFCTAFRLSSTRVATAEHCLWRTGRRLEADTLTFSLLARPEERFAFSIISEAAPSASKIADKNDVAVLELEPRAASDLPPLAANNRFDLDIPKDICGDAFVLIPGVFRPALVVRDDLLPGDWADAVRMDGTETCVRLSGAIETQCTLEKHPHAPLDPFYNEENFRSTRCIVVNCQTYPGMSGAPVIGFSKTENTLFAEGVFLRSGKRVAERRNTCLDVPGMNIGITYPTNAIEMLTSE